MGLLELIKKYGYANYHKGFYRGSAEHKLAANYEKEEQELLGEIVSRMRLPKVLTEEEQENYENAMHNLMVRGNND